MFRAIVAQAHILLLMCWIIYCHIFLKYFFKYIFNDAFKDALSGSYYIASNGKISTVNSMDVEGSGRDVIKGTEENNEKPQYSLYSDRDSNQASPWPAQLLLMHFSQFRKVTRPKV
jgi:hypothetical protein